MLSCILTRLTIIFRSLCEYLHWRFYLYTKLSINCPRSCYSCEPLRWKIGPFTLMNTFWTKVYARYFLGILEALFNSQTNKQSKATLHKLEKTKKNSNELWEMKSQFFLIGSWFNIWVLHTERHSCQDSRSASTRLVTWAVPRHQLCPCIWLGQVPLIVHMTGHSRMTWIYFIMLPLILFSNSEWIFCVFVLGFCLGLWPLSPLQFGFSHFLVIFGYLLVMAPQMHLRSSSYWCFWKLIFPMLSLFSLALLLMWGHLVIWQIWATCHQKDWI